MVSVRIIATFHSIMTKAAFFLLSWSVFSVELSNGQCDYSDELTSAHPVRYLQYQYYREAVSCSWTIVSDYKINLSCTIFELPWSVNCFGDRLAVQISPSIVHRYCGNGSFNIQSESDSMVITLKSLVSSSGGRFFCEVEALSNPQNCSCGTKNPSRIVGGTNAGVNEFPMMCGIVDAIQRIVFCGATIISNRYVLTAAHCMIGRDFQNIGVLVGDHDLETGTDTNAAVLHRVIQAIIHPRYNERSNENDVGILKTEKDITFNNQVGPVCLPFQHSPDTFGGNYVELLGWGTTDFGGPPSDILQKVTVSVLTNQQCSKIYPNVTTNQICTYAKGKDSCQMDSGGPVLWQDPTTRRLVLIGIISMGRGCALVAGLNTRVGAYIDWIVSATSGMTLEYKVVKTISNFWNFIISDAWYCTVE
ncbi:Venom serine protease 34 [Melipona quadrifasciata]|uniref:Venom serine protease 34 n=1 Tax=Melipona quadrifasciata TaxID=166423 RepID=A0A0N0BF80_9HYME|nr:Venom serine protease 34 [Melipona quadrifasciata]